MSASRAQLLHLLTKQASADQYGGCGGAVTGGAYTGGFKGESAFLRAHRNIVGSDPAYPEVVAQFNQQRRAAGQKTVKNLPFVARLGRTQPRAPKRVKAPKPPRAQEEQMRTELRKLLKTPRTPAGPILARARALLC